VRIALVLIALLALSAANAQADVFVPADPFPPPRVDTWSDVCAQSAGDVAVTGKRHPGGGWRIRVREGGAAWRDLGLLIACPDLQVAADGTAALTVGDIGTGQLFVRPPGGAFGAAIRLDGPPTAAVAAGGWVAAAWVTDRDATHDHTFALKTLVSAPSGAASRQVAERARFTEVNLVSLSQPLLTITPGGAATMVWTRSNLLGEAPSTPRIGRAAAGGAWSVANLPSGAEPSFSDQSARLAASPNGHTLVTWINSDGVQAMLDTEPYGTIAYASEPNGARPVVTDSGTALITFGARDGQVFAVEHPAGGGWLPARQVSGSLADLGLEGTSAVGTIAADGRAVVAWEGGSVIGHGSLVAAAGRIGAAWSAPVRLSSPVRELGGWSLRPGPAGEPGLEWTESDGGVAGAAIQRSARLVPDAEAPPPDHTAPVVSTRLRSRLPRTSTGELRLRVPVRCSEACVARVDFNGSVVVRDLAAGEQSSFAMGLVGDALLARPGLRRLPLKVLVADRAGNLTRRSQTVRVRVARRPLRSFKISANHDLATCTKAGNRRLVQLVNSIIEGLADKSLRNARDIRRRWHAGVGAIERALPNECLDDTDVREHVFVVLDTPLTLAGYPDFYLDG
jgi:hypothetical protein